ncbi:MAG TPA: hypothetical protein VHS28_10275 [Chloroflexota bacterium]|nr:hypothetical protein [Chloroflexota bacterium]
MSGLQVRLCEFFDRFIRWGKRRLCRMPGMVGPYVVQSVGYRGGDVVHIAQFRPGEALLDRSF